MKENEGRVPIIISSDDKGLENSLKKTKYLFIKSYRVIDLITFLKQENNDAKLWMEADKTVFVKAQNKVLKSDQVISDVYDKEKNQDGFLYLQLSFTQAFGI